jgi:Low psii accumulation1 / Rep27
MTEKPFSTTSAAAKNMDPALLRRLRAESQSPYRSLRRFFYLSLGASGFIGGVVFLAKAAAGKELETTLPNLALQVGVVVVMVTLYRWESKKAAAAADKM